MVPFPSRWTSWLIVGVALCYGVFFAIEGRWVCDDAFISFRYARNLIEGHGLVFNTGAEAPVEGYTNFLWTMLLAGGMALGLAPVAMGQTLGVMFFAATVVLLGAVAWRQSTGATRGVGVVAPVAALGLGLHHHSGLFATCGLETSMFTFLVTLALTRLVTARTPRQFGVVGLVLILATMTRPDGALFYILAGLFTAFWSWRERRAAYLVWFAASFVGLYLPYFVWKFGYYGHALPNTFYAKSASVSHVERGISYVGIYLACYFVLIPGILAAAFFGCAGLRRGGNPAKILVAGWQSLRAPILIAGFVITYCAYVIWVGGDFMFSRFCLPVTPAMFLGWQLLASRSNRLGIICLAAIVVGTWQRPNPALMLMGSRWDVVEEKTFYPDWWVASAEQIGNHLRESFADVDLRITIRGGQAMLAYYTDVSVAVEQHGLTDAYIARNCPSNGVRAGHSRMVSLLSPYLSERGVDMEIAHTNYLTPEIEGDRIGKKWRQFEFYMEGVTYQRAALSTWMHATLITYDRDVLDAVAGREGFRVPRFEDRLDEYLATIDQQPIREVEADFAAFKQFYFDHNDDPERLAAFARHLARAGPGK